MSLLWPDADQEKARHGLAQLIYHTRKVCGEPGLIVGTNELRLDATLADVDTFRADAALAAGDDALVAQLHRGPFLDGFYLPASPAFEHWLDLERRRRLDEVRGALERLADRASAAGDWTRAADALSQRLALDPLDSVAVERLAECLLAGSAPADAVRVIDVHEKVLRHELDVALPGALVRLRERVREGDPAAAPAPAPGAPVATPQQVPWPPTPSAPPAPERPAAPPSTAAPGVGRQWRWLLPMPVAIAALAFWVFRPGSAPAAEPTVADIAIAPFRTEGTDPALKWLGDGVVELLSMRLAEASGSDVVDPGRTYRTWRALPGATTGAASVELARALGTAAPARRVVLGSATGDAGRLVLDARLIDVATGSTVATGSASGALDSIGPLVAVLAAQLAADEQQIAAPAGPVRSLGAIRQYLDGRAAERQGYLGRAVAAYEAALGRDSTFAEAALRLAYVAWRRNSAEPHDRALGIALGHRDRLSDDDRALLTALAGPRYPAPTGAAEQRVAWELIASRTPDLPDAWRGLGLLYLNHGAVLGLSRPIEQARQAFEKALALDDADASTWRGLAAATVAGADSAAVARLWRRLPATPAMPVARAMLAHARGDAAALSAALAAFPSRDADALRDAAMAAQHGLLPDSVGRRALGLLLGRRRSAAEQVDLLLAQHSAAVQSGDERGRLRVLADLDAQSPSVHAGRRLRVLDAVVLGGDTAGVRAARDSMTADLARAPLDPIDAAARLADRCVLALASAESGDVEGARGHVAALRRAQPPSANVPVLTPPGACAELVEASLAASARRPFARRTVARVDDFTLSGGAIGDASRWADVLLARWYLALGDRDAARDALSRRPFFDGWPRYRRAAEALARDLAAD